jgi:hypothetical protein
MTILVLVSRVETKISFQIFVKMRNFVQTFCFSLKSSEHFHFRENCPNILYSRNPTLFCDNLIKTSSMFRKEKQHFQLLAHLLMTYAFFAKTFGKTNICKHTSLRKNSTVTYTFAKIKNKK